MTPRPAHPVTMIVAQTKVELALSVRRGESLLVTLVLPSLLLVFFGTVPIVPADSGRVVDFLVPGIVALAIMSTSMVSVGISTAFERHYHVLKRLGGSPLSRQGLLIAKIAAVLLVESVQVGLLLSIAIFVLGWQPTGQPVAVVLAILLGTAAFGGIGLAMAGTLRSEATLAAANGLYVVLMLLGGMVFPISRLPEPLSTIAGVLPAAALAESLRGSLHSGGLLPLGNFAVLLGWAIAMPIVAAATFKWE